MGVKRQYSGTAGRVENSQVGVFLAYTSPHGRAFIDRALYLPKEWAADTDRRRAAGVPDAVEFATKPQLAQRMLAPALDAGMPMAWVMGDEVYGGDRTLRVWLEEREQPFVLAITSNEALWSTGTDGMRQRPAAEIVSGIAETAWQRLIAGDWRQQ